MRRKILWIGDAAVATGFARCTHHTLKAFEGDWDIFVLGLNYRGDPHKYPYAIYPCWPGGDTFGLGRTASLVTKLRPDVVVVQNDPWNVPEYLKRAGNVPVVATMPVDGKNCCGRKLNGLAGAIFWTEFGMTEARRGGYTGPSAIVPLGVDLDVYRPVTSVDARKRFLPEALQNAFIVGNINRNQPRKRLDLTIEYFATWVKANAVKDAYLFLHVAPTGDQGYDVSQLMEYYGLSNRLILAEPDIGDGISEAALALTYSCFDVQVSTTQGEGWGLCTMEGMACGVPQIVPAWAALKEWAAGASRQVPCSTYAVTPNYVNVIGGISDRAPFVDALDELYRSSDERMRLSHAGMALVARPEYRWKHIAEQFRTVVEQALQPVMVQVGGRLK